MTHETVFSATIRRAATVASLLVSAAAFAQVQQAPVVYSGPDVAITVSDIEAAAQRIPLASRNAVMSRTENVTRQAQDLYARRALAREAERDGLHRDPIIHALLQQARERILSDARLAEIEQAGLPEPAAVTKAANDLYRSDTNRFQTPAQTRVRHILIGRAPDGSSKAQAEALLEELKSGKPFDDLAKARSSDLATASKGGDLGWFSPGAMVKEFEDAVAAIKNIGELSPIIETQFGYHIIKLDARREAGVRPFDEVREEIERDVRTRARAAARETKLRQLLESAKPDASAIEAAARQYRTP